MASFTLFANSTTAQTLADGEFGFIGQLGSLATSATAIDASGSVTVSVLGSLFSATGNAFAQNGEELQLDIGSAGGVGAANSDSVNARITDSAFVSNDGSLFSGSDALDLRNSDTEARITIINTGTISGLSDGVVTSSGTDATRIVNRGEIIGGTGGIDHLGGNAVLINHGDIAGESYGYDGALDVDSVRNTGRIEGGVLLLDGDDRVRNSGFIDTVDLGDGLDDFEGRGGTVGGIVEGGLGDDVIRGGDEADNLRGGLDNDVLRGRGGDDSLRGDGGEDVLNGSEGNDVLRGGGGADTFRFGFGDGSDTISDLGSSDVIDLEALGVRSFGGVVRDAIVDVAGGTVIDLFDDFGLRIFVQGVDSDQITAGDFLI